VPEWLDNARQSLAEALDESGADYELSQGDVERLLELARVAAHESGDRTNAPLISYLVGLARGRHPDRTLAELIAATRSDA
jgi:hypothetical protein